MKALRHLSVYLTALVSLCCTAPLFAQENGADEQWYTVEVLAFRDLSNTLGEQPEQWPHDISLAYPPEFMTLAGNNGSDNTLGSGSYTVLPEDERQLKSADAKMRRSRHYRILFHQAWQQPIKAQDKALPLLIEGGKQFGEHFELSGSINLFKSRYLHIHTNLWLTDFTTNNPDLENPWPALPELSAAQNGKPQEQLNNRVSASHSAYVPSRIVTMMQKRRMRSKEIHYLDHPLFGLIVMITPLEQDKLN